MAALRGTKQAQVGLFKGPGELLKPEGILHPNELMAWKKMTPSRASSFLRGRYALKSLFVPEQNRFHYQCISSTPAGKPYIASRPQTFCSISHTDNYAAAAILSAKAIGVDIEKIQSRHPALLKSISTKNEIEALSHRYNHKLLPIIVWTIKEAVAKADIKIFPFNKYKITLGRKLCVRRGKRSWNVQVTQLPSHVYAVAIAK